MLLVLAMCTLLVSVSGARNAASRIMQQRGFGLSTSLAMEDRAAVVRAVGRSRSRFLANARGMIVPTVAEGVSAAKMTATMPLSNAPGPSLAELEAAAIEAEAAAAEAEAAADAAEAEAKAAAQALAQMEAAAGASAGGASALALDAAALADLEAQIAAQGNVVRELKTALKDGKAEKAAVDAAVGVLVALKAKLPAEAAVAAPKSKKETKAAAPAAAPTAAPTAAPAAPTTSAPATVGGDGGLAVSIDDVINVCKRRGIIFQSSEVYGGYAGFWDYGPLGVELRANIKQAWWRDMVHRRDDVVGLDSSIIGSPKIWKASGHIDGFSDPMVDCRTSKLRFRADQLFWSRAEVDGQLLGYVSLLETDDMDELVLEAATKLQRKAGLRGTLSCTPVKDFTEASDEEQSLVPSPATGEAGSLTPPRAFNLMFQTNVGAMVDQASVAYLRPETAQGIFTNFKNVVATGRVKVLPSNDLR